MQHSKLVKGITLVSFVVFIMTYILYRAGTFDAYVANHTGGWQTSPNGPTFTRVVPEPLHVSDSAKYKRMQKKVDSMNKALPDSLRDKRRWYIGSSKSMLVFMSEDLTKKMDTLPMKNKWPEDSLRKKQIQDSIDQRNRMMMSSSKSGPVFHDYDLLLDSAKLAKEIKKMEKKKKKKKG